MNWTKIISWVSGILVLLLAIGGFVLSYNALSEVALSYGVPAELAWLWPLLVDGAIVVFSFAVLRANLMNERASWYWTLVIVFTLATIAFNVIHSGLEIVRVIVAIVAPIALVLSFEAVMSMLKNSVIRSGLIQSLTELVAELSNKRIELDSLTLEKQAEMDKVIEGKQVEVDNLQSQIGQWQGQLAELANEYEAKKGQLADELETIRRTIESYSQDVEAKREELKRLDSGQIKIYVPGNLTMEQRQELVAKMDNDKMTNEQIAAILGVSIGTVKNDKRAMREVIPANQNGKH